MLDREIRGMRRERGTDVGLPIGRYIDSDRGMGERET